MSETTNLKLFKHDNPSTNTDKFDVKKALNDNWDKIDEAIGDINTKNDIYDADLQEIKDKNTEQDKNIAGIQAEQITQNADIEELKAENERLKEDLNNSTISASSSGENITIEGSAEARFKKLVIKGNSVQETSEQGENLYDANGDFINDYKNFYAKENVADSNVGTNIFNHYKINTRCKLYYSMKQGESKFFKIFDNTSAILYLLVADKDGLITKRLGPTNNYTALEDCLICIILHKPDNTDYTDEECETLKNSIMISTEEKEIYKPFIPNMPSIDYSSPIRNCGDNVNVCPPLVKGKGISSSSGEETTLSTSAATDFIEINFTKNQNYIISGLMNTLYCFIASYDKDKNFMGRTNSGAYTNIILSDSIFTNSVPEEVKERKYIKITQYENRTWSGKIDDVDNAKIKIEKGIEVTPYSPPGCGNVNFLIAKNNLLKPTWAQDLLNRLGITSEDQENCITEIDNHKYFKYHGNLNKNENRDLVYFAKNCFKNNTQYTLKCVLMRDVDNLSTNIAFKYTDGTSYTSTLKQSANMTRTEYKITSGKNKTVKSIGIYYNTDVTYIDLDSVILYEGIDDMPFEEDYAKAFSFPTKQGQVFHKGDYLADDGVHQIKTTIIFNEMSKFTVVKENEKTVRFEYSELTVKENANVLCDKLKRINDNTLDEEHINVGASNKRIFIWINKSRLNTPDVAGLQTYLKDNQIKVEVELAEEIEPYSPEQQEAWKQIKNAKTYKGTTHIFCTDEISCEFEEEHLVDLEAYINSKIGATSADTPIQEQPSIQEGPNMEEPSTEESYTNIEKETEEVGGEK